jgi:hypothetical protein
MLNFQFCTIDLGGVEISFVYLLSGMIKIKTEHDGGVKMSKQRQSFSHGQLGQGHIETVKEPTPVDYLGGLQIRDVAAGYWHSLAVTGKYAVECWLCQPTCSRNKSSRSKCQLSFDIPFIFSIRIIYFLYH